MGGAISQATKLYDAEPGLFPAFIEKDERFPLGICRMFQLTPKFEPIPLKCADRNRDHKVRNMFPTFILDDYSAFMIEHDPQKACYLLPPGYYVALQESAVIQNAMQDTVGDGFQVQTESSPEPKTIKPYNVPPGFFFHNNKVFFIEGLMLANSEAVKKCDYWMGCRSEYSNKGKHEDFYQMPEMASLTIEVRILSFQIFCLFLTKEEP